MITGTSYGAGEPIVLIQDPVGFVKGAVASQLEVDKRDRGHSNDEQPSTANLFFVRTTQGNRGIE